QFLHRHRVDRIVGLAVPATGYRQTYKVDNQLQCIPSSFRLDLVSSFFKVFTCNWPSVFPQQRTDSKYAKSVLIEVTFIVAGHLFDAVFNDDTSKVTRSDKLSFC